MPAFQPARFDRLDTPALVAALESTNGWRRDKAQQILLWRADPAALPPLLVMAETSRQPLARLHALCTLDGLGQLPPATVVRALRDATPGIRENALRLAETRFTPETLAAALRLADDPDAKVRLQLVFSLGATNAAAAGETLGRLLATHASDPMMVAAVMSSATPHLRALVAASANRSSAPLVDSLLATALGLNDREVLGTLLAPTFTAAVAGYTADQIAAFARFLDQLTQAGSSLDKLRAASPQDALGQLLARAAIITAQVRLTATDAKAPAAERIAAAALLSRSPPTQAESLPLLAAWLDPKHPLDDQAAAIRALGAVVTPAVPAALAKAWPTMSPGTRKLALNAWLGREPWAFDLARRLERKELAASVVEPTVRARLLKHESKRVSQLAAKIFDASSSARSKVVENYRPALSLPGDPGKGHQVFTLVCAACHPRGPEGRDVGPDLISVVDHPPEKLLSSILDPSADIQPGFNAYTCTLNTGEQIYGLLASESATGVVMKLVDGTIRHVLRTQIATLQSPDVSLMPEGLEGAIDRQGMADLIAFLRQPLTGAGR
jgi:putative heme-binding domain-containing protein